MALAGEAAAKKSKEMQAGRATTPPAPVQRVQHHGQMRRKRTSPPTKQRKECYRCGGKHKSSVCWFKDAICNFCEKPAMGIWLGFVARNGNVNLTGRCIASPPAPITTTRIVMLTSTTFSGMKPYVVKVTLNDALLEMELDTGAAVSLINIAT